MQVTEQLLNPVALVSLAITASLAIISFIIALFLGKRCHQSDKWVIFWLSWDAMIHFIVEGPFLVISFVSTVEASDHFAALPWKEYGKADKRWLVSDPDIVSMELLTVFFCGPLCLCLIYAICKRSPHRHFIQIILCACELYGGWMTFCPDWLIGSPNLATDNWLYLWVYLVFFNGIWVLVPLVLLYQSWSAMANQSAASGQGVKRYSKYKTKKAH